MEQAVGPHSRQCPLCRNRNASLLYRNVTDQLYGATGKWDIVRCVNPSCAIAWLEPPPSPAELSASYANYYTHGSSDMRMPTWATSFGLWIRHLDQTLGESYLSARYGYRLDAPKWRWLLACILPTRFEAYRSRAMFLPAASAGNLLDVGAGNGDLIRMVERFGWRAEGVDNDEAAVRTCKDQKLNVRLGTLEQQSYAAASFDAVVLRHVIEHISDPTRVLAECLRVLRSSGRIVIITPNLNAGGARLFGAAWRGLEPPRHLRVYTAPALCQLLQTCGFRVLTARSMTRSGLMFARSLDILARAHGWRLPRWLKHGCRLAFEAVAVLEYIACSLKQDVGEELVIVGAKG